VNNPACRDFLRRCWLDVSGLCNICDPTRWPQRRRRLSSPRYPSTQTSASTSKLEGASQLAWQVSWQSPGTCWTSAMWMALTGSIERSAPRYQGLWTETL
jgi:hypothetical protein